MIALFDFVLLVIAVGSLFFIADGMGLFGAKWRARDVLIGLIRWYKN